MFGIRDKVAKTAKKAGFLTGGLLFCSVGMAFLTVAGWLALAPIVGPQVTATIIAGVYLGIGFILIGLGAGGETETREEPAAKPAATDSDSPPIIQAFMYGLQAGARADQARHAAARPGSSSL